MDRTEVCKILSLSSGRMEKRIKKLREYNKYLKLSIAKYCRTCTDNMETVVNGCVGCHLNIDPGTGEP